MAYIDDIKSVGVCLPYEKLSGKNILITGATGLIGSAIVDILMNLPSLDFQVYAAGRNIERAKSRFADYIEDPHFHFIKYDALLPLDCSVDFHYIIAAASSANPILYSTEPVNVMKGNLWGVDNLFIYGLAHKLEKLVFVSSGDVYGEGDGNAFTEDYSGYVNPLNLRSCYTSAKRAAESLCISYASQYGIQVSIARPCHTYGPHFTESDTRAYAQFIRNVLNNEDIIMKSAGSQFRSWCYVVDCASGILFILLNGSNGQAYNIADDDSDISIKELAEKIAYYAGKKVITETPDEVEKRGFNVVNRSVFSNEKLKGLGWKSNYSINQGLKSTIDELIIKKSNA